MSLAGRVDVDNSATAPSARILRDCGIAVPGVAEHRCYAEQHSDTIPAWPFHIADA
jgi:hypothetical protein